MLSANISLNWDSYWLKRVFHNQPTCVFNKNHERFSCWRQDCRKQTNICLHAWAHICLCTDLQPVSSSRQICISNHGCFCPQLCRIGWSKALFTLLGASWDASVCSSRNVQQRLCYVTSPIQVTWAKNKAEWLWKSEHDCGDSKDGEKSAGCRVNPFKTAIHAEKHVLPQQSFSWQISEKLKANK